MYSSCILNILLLLSLYISACYSLTYSTDEDNPLDGDLRLINIQVQHNKNPQDFSNKSITGILQIYYSGSWGYICPDRWDDQTAQMACLQMGFLHFGSPLTFLASELKLETEVNYWMKGSNMSCDEKKNSSITECKEEEFGGTKCSLESVAGANCTFNYAHRVKDLPLRLIDIWRIETNRDGNSWNKLLSNAVPYGGLLQAKYGNEWHFVSGQGWGVLSGTVACNQLGYPELREIPSYQLSSGSVSVFMSHVKCLDGDSELRFCSHHGFTIKKVNWNSVKIAAVICVTRQLYMKNNIQTTRLRGALSFSEGRVQMLDRGKWLRVCSSEFYTLHANIACRSAGYGSVKQIAEPQEYGRSVGDRFISNLKCSHIGVTTSLSSCRYKVKIGCDGADVVLKCRAPEYQMVLKGPQIKPLRNHNNSNDHVIHFLHRFKQWETVCCQFNIYYKHTLDLLCSEMGLGFSTGVIRCVKNSSLNAKLRGHLLCKEETNSLVLCSVIITYKSAKLCEYVLVIGCSNERPDLVPSLTHLKSSLRYFNSKSMRTVNDYRKTNLVDKKYMSQLKCAFEEGCLSSTANINDTRQERSLLRFTSHTDNYGTADFRPPTSFEDWIWHTCHNHFHSMEVFVTYHLLDSLTRVRVAEGHKASFCLEDSLCPGNYRKYQCDSNQQGISMGCGDTYGSDIDCQWIDITDVQSGNYTVEVNVNPSREVLERDYSNNIISCDINFDATTGYFSTYNCHLSDH